MPQPEHIATHSRIEGEYVNISLSAHNTLRSYLQENETGYAQLYLSQPETLPYPIDNLDISFRSYEKEYPELHAGFNISSQCLNSFDLGSSWQHSLHNLLSSIFSENELDIYTLKHEESCLHVRINEVYAVRISLGSSTEHGTVDVTLEPLDDLFNASEGDISFDPDPDECEEPDIIETLRQFSQATSVAIDAVIGLFGEPTLEKLGKPTITLAPPSDFNSKDNNILEHPELSLQEQDGSIKSFSMIGGLERPKQRMQEIANIYRFPEEAALYNLRPNHLLIHGIAGSGKTSLVQAFALETGAELRTIFSSEIIEKWVGNSASNIRQVFEEAKKNQNKQVLFFDEFDILGKSGSNTNDERASVTKELGVLIDEVSKDHPNIIVICAGNAMLDHFEPSLVRNGRLEAIAISIPDEAERIDIWSAVLTDALSEFGYGTLTRSSSINLIDGEPFVPYTEDINPVELAKITDGMVGADFVYILERARARKFTEYVSKKLLPDSRPERVSQHDLVKEIQALNR